MRFDTFIERSKWFCYIVKMAHELKLQLLNYFNAVIIAKGYNKAGKPFVLKAIDRGVCTQHTFTLTLTLTHAHTEMTHAHPFHETNHRWMVHRN